jgi:uncharacterized protein YacL (UPF0231 family)
MRIKGAMTILKKRAEFYGMTIEALVEWLDHKVASQSDKLGYVDETIKVLQAYEVYKMDQGYQWSGVNHETWVKNAF